MKKLLLCASAFALMLGSCSKDDTEVAPVSGNNEVIFTAGMTIGNDTRTGVSVDPNDKKRPYIHGISVIWSAPLYQLAR